MMWSKTWTIDYDRYAQVVGQAIKSQFGTVIIGQVGTCLESVIQRNNNILDKGHDTATGRSVKSYVVKNLTVDILLD